MNEKGRKIGKTMQRRRNNFSVINPLRLILIIGTYSSIVLASGIDLGELSDLYEVIPTSKFTVEDLVASLEVKKETKGNEDLNLLSGEIKYGEVKKNKKRKDDTEKETKDDKIQILNVTSSSGDNKNDTQNQQQTNISSSSGENKNNKVNKTSDALLNEDNKKGKINKGSNAAENNESSNNNTKDKSVSGEIKKNEIESKTKSEKNSDIQNEKSEGKPKEKKENKGKYLLQTTNCLAYYMQPI